MEIQDKRDQLAHHQSKNYRRRAKSAIKNIAIHHSLTTAGSAESFARYHVNHLGWPGIGYHYVVDKDGTITWCHDIEVVSYHVGNSNIKAVGICMVGDFRKENPTDAQMEATYELTSKLLSDLNIKVEDVWGHSEFPNYSWKACPCIDMGDFRSALVKKLDVPVEVVHKGEEYKSGPRKRNILSQGDQGDDVKALQERLDELGFQPGPIDGIYGPLTFDSVQRFQRAANITVDGIVGPETREALRDFEKTDDEIEQGSPTDEPDENEALFEQESRRMLRYTQPMMSGEDVLEVQQKVGAVVDGIYGPNTADKVRDFQRRNNLLVDGIVGPETWRALDRTNKYQPTYERLLSVQTPYMRGTDVKKVQRKLGVEVDGLYGPQTERAVMNFQRKEGITVDGIVGPQTWDRLF